MFAGAAREAVFSNPDVIRRVNADFIPVSLKAALVNRPLDDELFDEPLGLRSDQAYALQAVEEKYVLALG